MNSMSLEISSANYYTKGTSRLKLYVKMKLYKKFRRAPTFLSVSNWITDNDNPVKSGPDSRPAIIIPFLVLQFGSLKAKIRSIIPLRKQAVRLFSSMRESAKNIRKNPRTNNRAIDEVTLAEVENLARQLGCSEIGYTKVNPNHIFKDFEILYDNAIMLTMEMNKEAIESGPSDECMKEIIRTYGELGVAVNKIANYLRDKGFNCHPSPAIGGDINTVPTAQDANLGCIGKNGILITPNHGPCVRLAAVFIDVDNLPMAQKNDHMWISDFCETCKRCVRKCPAGAIYSEPHFIKDYGQVFIDPEKCAPPFSEGCSVCISSCVFTRGKYDRLKKVHDRRNEQSNLTISDEK